MSREQKTESGMLEMKELVRLPIPLLALSLAAAAIGLAYAWLRISAETASESVPTTSAVVVTTHAVTEEMARASEEVAGKAAPEFRAIATDGGEYTLTSWESHRPLILVFIKDGCPCSDAAQPYFNRLFEAYGPLATFLGVIGSDLETAGTWARTHNVLFPIIADPDQRVIRAYEVANSAYVALVQDGRVDNLWPGYSTSTLAEISSRIAALAGVPVAAISFDGAPSEPYSGCPFEFD